MNKYFSISNQIINNNRFRCLSRSALVFKKAVNIEAAESEPIRYTTSQASKWRASVTRSGIRQPRLWYEPYVILGSLGVFMLYFFILREENDIDEELMRTLYSRIQGLEEHQLRQSLEYNEKHNLNTQEIRDRLNELQSQKA